MTKVKYENDTLKNDKSVINIVSAFKFQAAC